MSHPSILLTDEQSRALREAGRVFIVAGPASWPEAGRIRLHLLPVSMEAANKAADVAQGKLLTRKRPSRKLS